MVNITERREAVERLAAKKAGRNPRDPSYLNGQVTGATWSSVLLRRPLRPGSEVGMNHPAGGYKYTMGLSPLGGAHKLA